MLTSQVYIKDFNFSTFSYLFQFDLFSNLSSNENIMMKPQGRHSKRVNTVLCSGQSVDNLLSQAKLETLHPEALEHNETFKLRSCRERFCVLDKLIAEKEASVFVSDHLNLSKEKSRV